MSNSFNYIAFGNWDYLNTGAIEMSRGRMFEYTPTNIERQLENLNEQAIEFLEKLPTFFCSEISKTHEGASMLIKYGHIKDTTADNKAVSTKFTPSIDFGEVQFSNLEQARDVLQADGFQLYRTHWAVREGAPGGILTKLAEFKPEFDNEIKQNLKPDNDGAATNPPQRSKKTLGTADSVESFLKFLYEIPAEESTENFFRGHHDANFQLTPSLLRKSPSGSPIYMLNEDRLCKELLIAHNDEFDGDQYRFDRLVRMQHYGLPTRLLDISSNPLIALFFACYCADQKEVDDGEVIIFRVSTNRVKYYDSDTVSCLSNLSNLTRKQKNDIDLKLDREEFNKSDVAHKLLHHIRSEKGYFESRILPNDLRSIICVKAKRNNSRILSQSGAFLLFGQEVTLPEDGQGGIEIDRVTIKEKQNILKQLDSININAATVYPSIEQTTKRLRQQYS